jgi:hypothetical protein
MIKAPHRRVVRTVLLVGEGDAEEIFLRHLKRLYISRGLGSSVTIKNAHGRGAQQVVHFAIRQSRVADYDVVAALFDTDVAWTDSVKKAANNAKIRLLLCQPCFESMALEMFGRPVHGLTSSQLKQRFTQEFGCSAHDERYLRDTDTAFFEAARQRVNCLDELLKIICPAG